MPQPVSSTAFNTIFSWAKANNDGTISFGDVDEDNVKNAVSLCNNYDPRHYFKMSSTGRRKSRTSLESPRGITIKTGQDMQPHDGTFTIQVENGNLVLDIQNGDLDIKARNVNFDIEGRNNEEGNFVVNTNQKIKITSSFIDIIGKQRVEVSANNVLKLVGDTHLELIVGIANCVSYSSRMGTKGDCQSDTVPGDIRTRSARRAA